MTGRDKAKIQAAGFRIFYMVPGENAIKEQINGSMRVYSRHKSKAEMMRSFRALMEDPKAIEI